MELVMSDEFSTPGRKFDLAAKDKRWLAMDYFYKATNDLEAYKPEAVSTRACIPSAGENCETRGLMSIKMSHELVNVSYAPESWGPDPSYNKEYKSGAINGWNKFCFTGGYVEARVKMPRGDGLW